MLIDSHCHLDRLDLAPYQGDFSRMIEDCQKQEIEHLLCIAIDLENYSAMVEKVRPYPMISWTVGVHPSVTEGQEPTVDQLIELAADPRVIAIGETGLDFYREHQPERQIQRLTNHIQVAKALAKPLIIHTRDAGGATLRILKQERADQVGGIIHCFTEAWEFAQKAMDIGFYISFSGIVTFKNATALREVAAKVPDERLLIETDSPYLAPTPYRGKENYPFYVRYVAETMAELRGCSLSDIVRLNRANFSSLFPGILSQE